MLSNRKTLVRTNAASFCEYDQICQSVKTRLSHRLATVATLVLALTSAISCLANSSRKPNVVLILADDLGHKDLGCMGSELYETPNIDSLAKSSMTFENAYTSPTCSPSRAAILSGKNPARLGIVGHGGIRSMRGGGEFLVAEEYTIAEALLDAGYATCHIGKWHVGTKPETRPAAQGFDTVIASNNFCCPGSYFYPFRDKSKTGKAAERSAVPDLEDYDPDEHLSMCLGQEAAKYISQRKGKDKPFFLNLWYYAVHTPIEAKRDKVNKYRKLVQPDANQRNPAYAGLVEHLDDSVGLVLDALEENGFAENTIVVFFSDNGGEVRRAVTSNHPLRSGKASLYEGGVRVPMFVRWPGVTAGGETCRSPVVGHDLYPTILGMTKTAGQPEQNSAMDGKDFSTLLGDPASTLPPRTFCWLRYGEMVHYPSYKTDPVFGPAAAIQRDGWKLIEHYPTPAGLVRRFELFNLREDPNEKNDLAHERADMLKDLQQALSSWQKEIEIPPYEELALPAFAGAE